MDRWVAEGLHPVLDLVLGVAELRIEQLRQRAGDEFRGQALLQAKPVAVVGPTPPCRLDRDDGIRGSASRRLMTGASLALVTLVLCAASVTATARPTATASKGCHVPRLTGLTLEVARVRAAHARCTLRVKGAPLDQARIQTVERQSPAGGRRSSSSVTVWLNPVCRGSAAYGPTIKEPVVTNGPTELVSGFYLDGGPLSTFSDPNCLRPEPPPDAGTVEVIDASGVVVATSTSATGHFVKIPLPAGSYTIRGTFLDATINGAHPTKAESVVIPPYDTVRQDFFLSIP